MNLLWSYPTAFTLLVILPVFVWIWRDRRPTRQLAASPPRARARGTRAPVPARRWISLGLRMATLLAIILALAGPQSVDYADDLQVIFVVDRSKSIPGRSGQAVIDSLAAAQSKFMKEKDLAGLVVFGSRAAMEARPARGRIFHGQITSVLEDDLTDIEAGVRLAMSSFPDDVGKRIVLISDGNENRGSLLEVAALAAANDVQIDVVPIRYDYPNELYVEKLVLPPSVNFGEPFLIKIVLSSTVACRARMTVLENDLPLDIGNQVVDVPKGKSVQTVKLFFQDEEHVEKIRKGFYVYEVRATPLDQTGNPDAADQPSNNTAIGFTQVQGRPAVLLIDGNQKGGDVLQEALKTQGILVRRIQPEALPSNIVELQGYDCIILSNVSAEHFTHAQMTILKSNVHDVGAGLIMVGGDQSFGAGGWLDTPVEQALPVYMDIKQQKVIPNGALCCIMHTCEFPNGNVWAKDITVAAMNTLSAQDYFGVVYYPAMGGPCEWGFQGRMVQPRDKRSLEKIIRRNLNPGDMPDFDNAFSVAAQGLAQVVAARKHIIVISDGDPQPPNVKLVQRIRNQGITISAIAIAPHSGGIQVLKNLAVDSGGTFYFVDDPRKLPRIFVHEAQVVKKAIIIEKELSPDVRSISGPVGGLLAGGVPKIYGYVATTAKETADVDVAMTVEEDMPLLATWSYGLGRAAAWTSDATTKWGTDWVGWGEFGQFWAQLVRSCNKNIADANFQVRASTQNGRATVVVDAVDSAGRFENNLRVSGTIVPSTGEEAQEVELVQTAPGHYEVEVKAENVGAYLVNLRYQRPGDEKPYAGQSAGFSVPYSPEFRQLSANEGILRQVAEMTDGHVLSGIDQELVLPGYTAQNPYNVFLHDQAPSRKPVDRWQSLLVLAAILFVLDIFVRRVRIDTTRITALIAVVLPFLRSTGARAELKARKLAEMMSGSSGQPGTVPARQAADPTWLGGDAESASAVGEILSGDGKPTATGAAERPHPPPADAATYTDRLLEAKRRAQKGRRQ